MRVLLICGDKRLLASTTKTLAAIGIDAIDVSERMTPAPQYESAADALVIWPRPLRRMLRRAPEKIAELARRMPLIVALAVGEAGALDEAAYLVNGMVFPDINLEHLGAIVEIARFGYLLLPAAIGGAQLMPGDPPVQRRGGLTPLERRALEALADGSTNREIARQLALSDSAVKRVIREALRKLRLGNRIQGAIYARLERSH
jgi:DNA-binding NarL/FixJ family response regulator